MTTMTTPTTVTTHDGYDCIGSLAFVPNVPNIWTVLHICPETTGIVVDFGKNKKNFKKAPFQGKKAHF